MRFHLIIFCCLFFLGIVAHAQRKLYLDLQGGPHYSYAEGAHFGLGNGPLTGHQFRLHWLVSPMLRLQLNQKTAVSVGYSSGMMGRGHRIFMPQAYSNNTYGTVYSFSTSGDEVHRLPVLLHHEVKRFNFTPINPEQTLYNYSVGLSVYGGGGLNYRRQINDGTAVSSISFMADTITEVQRARLVNKVGAFVTGGVTARFYRLGKEKLNLTLFLNQGLTDMLKVDLDYRYNRGHGTEQFRVRGSSVGLMLGVPIRLKTFEPTPPPGTR